MRKKINLCGIIFVLASSLVFAEAEFDFEELMESIDNNSHNLQGSIANKDANATTTLAKDMQNQFKLVEGFFEKEAMLPMLSSMPKNTRIWQPKL